jgi:hypothetical protein
MCKEVSPGKMEDIVVTRVVRSAASTEQKAGSTSGFQRFTLSFSS